MPKKKIKVWSYIAGEKGRNRIRVFDRRGRLCLEWTESGRKRRLILPCNDRELAKKAADKAAAEFAELARLRPTSETLNLASLIDMYLREVTPDKGLQKQHHDRATADMFLRFYGGGRVVRTLALQDWNRFIRERKDGRIAPALRKSRQGIRPQARTVRARTIDCDLEFIMSVFNWATEAGDGRGGKLLERNPFKGFKVPVEKSPVREILSSEEYRAMLKASSGLGWRHEVLLVLAHETGHRIGAIRQLVWEDVDLEAGAIHWPQHTDKIGMEHKNGLSEAAVAALVKARHKAATIGKGYVFPSLRDPGKPVGKECVAKVWGELERAAGVSHRKGLGWHSLRRKFATDWKSLPLRDIMELGGWRSQFTIARCYQAAPSVERQREILRSRVS
jgi:integrase